MCKTTEFETSTINISENYFSAEVWVFHWKHCRLVGELPQQALFFLFFTRSFFFFLSEEKESLSPRCQVFIVVQWQYRYTAQLYLRHKNSNLNIKLYELPSWTKTAVAKLSKLKHPILFNARATIMVRLGQRSVDVRPHVYSRMLIGCPFDLRMRA